MTKTTIPATKTALKTARSRSSDARRHRRVNLALIAGLAAFVASPRAHAANCEDMASAADPAAAARACVLAAEKRLGPDDPSLLPLLDRAAYAAAEGGRKPAAALGHRRRAHRLATRLYGEGDPRTADVGLAYAKLLILSGRCTAADPMALDLARAAAKVYAAAAASPERDDRLRHAAAALADGLAHREAAIALTELGAPSGLDWERIGDWRLRVGDGAEAARAYRRGIEIANDDELLRGRLIGLLRRMAFVTGDASLIEGLDTP